MPALFQAYDQEIPATFALVSMYLFFDIVELFLQLLHVRIAGVLAPVVHHGVGVPALRRLVDFLNS